MNLNDQKIQILNYFVQYGLVYLTRKYIKLPKNLGKKKLIISYKVKAKNDKGDLRTSNLIMENKQISILCGKLDAVTVIYKTIKKKIGL